MQPNVVVIDYRTGNSQSVSYALSSYSFHRFEAGPEGEAAPSLSIIVDACVEYGIDDLEILHGLLERIGELPHTAPTSRLSRRLHPGYRPQPYALSRLLHCSFPCRLTVVGYPPGCLAHILPKRGGSLRASPAGPGQLNPSPLDGPERALRSARRELVQH